MISTLNIDWDIILGNLQVGLKKQTVKTITVSGFEDVVMLKHISYIALCSDNPETGKTLFVQDLHLAPIFKAETKTKIKTKSEHP